MAEKITIEQVDELQAILRADVTVDVKVQHVTAAKSSIKQHNVPDMAVPPLFEALRTASSSQHVSLVNAGFTGLNHLVTRLSRQDPRLLGKEAARSLPLVVEKLGDQKEKFRVLAHQALTTLYAVAPMDVERSLRNTAMVGKNPRAKEASMQWLLQMHQEHAMPFRAYVPALMELLEDADGMVRDAAKATVIELFRTAPNTAKTDLKKQLKNFKVRPAIEQAIVKELAPTPPSASSSAISVEFEPRPESRALRPAHAASFGSAGTTSRPVTPVGDLAVRVEPVEPSYVSTQRELDDMFRDMTPFFEGRESEHNWLKREESITKLRRFVAGNATDFAETFLTGVRALLDGILKTVVSLRTSLCKEGCSLVQDLAHVFGPSIDPLVELLLQTLIKLSAGTKKISSQLANAAVDAILAKATYNSRMMQHVWFACQDKNVQPRMYATGWVRTILDKEARHKEHFEHTGGLEVLEKCIKKGLTDMNPGVRERMRTTYWAFYRVWPARADVVLSTLDATAQKLLLKDPGNPNSPPKTAESKTPARPISSLARSTTAPAKPSLREAMLAKKKEALATRTLPSRPGSAMAHFSPSRSTSALPQTAMAGSNAGGGAPTLTRQRTEGGLSVAPVRATKRRLELHARPATAGPYSVRGHDAPSVEQTSPQERPRSKMVVTPKSLAASPKRTTTAATAAAAAAAAAAARPRIGHKTTTSESSMASPPRTRLVEVHQEPQQLQQAQQTQPVAVPIQLNDEDVVFNEDMIGGEASPPPLKVYEDPLSGEQAVPKPAGSLFMTTVLEDRSINEDAAVLGRMGEEGATAAASAPTVADAAPALGSPLAVTEAPVVLGSNGVPVSPEKLRQNMRLLDSGIARVRAQTLDVHGFRRLQGIIRDAGSIGGSGSVEDGKGTLLTDERFEALLMGLFAYLGVAGTGSKPADKVQDVKAQILATIRLLLKKGRESFQPHVSRGLAALLAARATYDARTHIVAGLELLADELVTLGDASEIVKVVGGGLAGRAAADGKTAGQVAGQAGDGAATSPHTLSMGLHVLKVLVDARPGFQPSDGELALLLTGLAQQCLESSESGVRMDAVQLCVAVHERVGDGRFWAALPGVREDPRSLITYYIVKRQREGR